MQAEFDVSPRLDLKLSVVIPVYNERETLPRILRAVSQVLPGVTREIVLVDDCSQDGTRDWIKATFPAEENAVADTRRSADGVILFLGEADAASQPAGSYEPVSGHGYYGRTYAEVRRSVGAMGCWPCGTY